MPPRPAHDVCSDPRCRDANLRANRAMRDLAARADMAEHRLTEANRLLHRAERALRGARPTSATASGVRDVLLDDLNFYFGRSGV